MPATARTLPSPWPIRPDNTVIAHGSLDRRPREPHRPHGTSSLRPSSASAIRSLQTLIGNRAVGALLQRAPPKRPPVDPRGAAGHRDPLIKVPAAGAPPVEVVTEGARSVEWSWEVDRVGPGGVPFRQQVYWARFEVGTDGVMRVSARMVSETGQFRAPEWTLRGKFKEALEVFRLAGIQVNAFDAEWGYMARGEISANLDAFFGYLQENPGSTIAAAKATPSGKIAIEHGFTDVEVTAPGFEPHEHLDVPGKPGRQVRPVVRARFSLPASAPAPAKVGEPKIPTETPAVSGTAPKVGGAGPNVRGGAIRVGIGLGLQALLLAFFWWAGKKAAEKEEKNRKKLIEDKLDPAVGQALYDQSATIDSLTTRTPSKRLYANVEADVDFEWDESGIAGARSGVEAMTDVRLGRMTFSDKDLKGDRETKIERSGAQVTNVYQTKRMTFSLLVFDPEYEAHKAELFKNWDEFTKKHPRWRRTAVTGEAAKQLDRMKWVHEVGFIHEWREARLRTEMGLDRRPPKKPSNVTVIR